MNFFKLASIILGLAINPRHVVCASNNTGQWWRDPFTMLQTNIREIDANLDVEEVADYIESHGASAWLMSIGGILANYPTKLDFQTFNPISAEGRESGDMMLDVMKAARERNLRVLGRVDFSKVALPIAEANPDWLYISPNGTWQNHTNNVVSVCPSGEWYQERIFDILNEMTQYDLDGLFVNWISFNEVDYWRNYRGVCHCENCKKRWHEFAPSLDLPAGPEDDTYGKWQEFSASVIDDWTARVRDFISERLPDAGLLLGSEANIMFFEIHNNLDADIWHHATSETVSKFISWRPETPILVHAASFNDYGYRISAENALQYTQYHLQAMSRGANPSTYIIGLPDSIPWPGMKPVAELLNFFKQHQDTYKGLRPVAKTGLIKPEQGTLEEEAYMDHILEFRGMYRMLMQAHIPFDVLGEEYLSDLANNNGLDRFEVVIVPDMGKLDSDDAKLLDEWTSNGGTLIATGNVGIRYASTDDSQNEESEEELEQDIEGPLQLRSLPASRRKDYITDRQELYSLYFAPEQNGTQENVYEGNIVPLLGSYSVYQWRRLSSVIYKKLAFAPFAPPEYIYGNVQVEEPGAAVGDYQRGKGVLVTLPLGRAYRQYGLDTHRLFFEDIWAEVGAVEQISFNMSPFIEVTLNRNAKNQTIVHFVNHSGIMFKAYGQHLPVAGGEMSFSSKSRHQVKVHSLLTNQTLQVTDDGVVRLPEIDLYDVLVIEGLE